MYIRICNFRHCNHAVALLLCIFPNRRNFSLIHSNAKGISTAALTISGKRVSNINICIFLVQWKCVQCAFQKYSAFPGEQVNLSITPHDSLNKLTAFVFGYAQYIEGSSIPTGRIARYLDLSSDENVIHTFFMHTITLLPVLLKSEERVTFLSNIVEYLPGFPVRFEYRLPRNNRQLGDFTVAVYTPVKVDVSDVCIVCIALVQAFVLIDIHNIFEHHCGELSTWICAKKHRRWQ